MKEPYVVIAPCTIKKIVTPDPPKKYRDTKNEQTK